MYNELINAQINEFVMMQPSGSEYAPKIEIIKYLACLAAKGEVSSKDFISSTLIDKFNKDMQDCGLSIDSGKVSSLVKNCLQRIFTDEKYHQLPGYDFADLNRIYADKAAYAFIDKFKPPQNLVDESKEAVNYLAALLIDGQVNEVVIKNKALLSRLNNDAFKMGYIKENKIAPKTIRDGLDNFFVNDDHALVSEGKIAVLDDIRSLLKREVIRNTNLKLSSFIENHGDYGIKYLAILAIKGEVRSNNVKEVEKYLALSKEVEDIGLTTRGHTSTQTQDIMRSFFMDNASTKVREQFMNINKNLSQGRDLL